MWCAFLSNIITLSLFVIGKGAPIPAPAKSSHIHHPEPVAWIHKGKVDDVVRVFIIKKLLADVWLGLVEKVLAIQGPRQFGKFHHSQKTLEMSFQSAACGTGRNSSTVLPNFLADVCDNACRCWDFYLVTGSNGVIRVSICQESGNKCNYIKVDVAYRYIKQITNMITYVYIHMEKYYYIMQYLTSDKWPGVRSERFLPSWSLSQFG